MIRIELAPGVLDDIDRFLDHLVQHAVADMPGRVDELLEAIQVLAHSPMIGRPVKDGKRELVVGKGTRPHGFPSYRPTQVARSATPSADRLSEGRRIKRQQIKGDVEGYEVPDPLVGL